MKLFVYLSMVALVSVNVHATDDKAVQSVLKASRHLANQSGYSWVSTSSSAEGTLTWRQGPTHGKVQKGGYTHVEFMLGDSKVELAFRGNQAAIKLQDQWHGAKEMKDDQAWIAQRLRSYMIPAREASFLVRNVSNLQPAPDGAAGEFSGALKPKAVLHLLSRGRDMVTEAPEMKGRVKFTVTGGQLTRYEYNVSGNMNRPAQGDEVILDRTTVVEIHKVRETKVSLPEEARRKLQ